MKLPEIKPRRVVIDCVALLVVHALLLQLMAHTHIIENVMASQFSRWELALILAFVLVRLMIYLVIPSVLAALLMREILRRIAGRTAE